MFRIARNLVFMEYLECRFGVTYVVERFGNVAVFVWTNNVSARRMRIDKLLNIELGTRI
jgi:hypothetical protein